MRQATEAYVEERLAAMPKPDTYPRQRRAWLSELTDQGFPWGSQWPWGFEFVVSGETTSFRLHNPMMRVGPTLYRAIVKDGALGPSAYYKTADVSAYVSGNWGLAVDLDWAAGGGSLFDAEANVYTTEADLYAAQTQTPTSAPDRIPVAWFSGTSLVRDYLHGALPPQLWVDPA